MIKLKNILLEKRELNSRFVKEVEQMTDRNNHTEARYYLAHMMRNDKLSLFYSSMKHLNKVFGGNTPEMQKMMKKMEKELYKSIQKTFSNAKEIIGSL